MRADSPRLDTRYAPGATTPASGIASALRSTAPWFALTAYFACFLRILWRIGDEGSIIYGAERVSQGQLPYRDFFEVIGPGAFYSLAFWFKALGTSWLTTRIAIMVTAIG